MLHRGRPDDRAVREAEEIVRRAWARELMRRADHMDLAAQAAFAGCDTAARRLAAAQRDGDPWKIGVARAAALLALDTTRAAVLARDRARRALREELRVLAGKPRKAKNPAKAGNSGGPRIRRVLQKRLAAAAFARRVTHPRRRLLSWLRRPRSLSQ